MRNARDAHKAKAIAHMNEKEDIHHIKYNKIDFCKIIEKNRLNMTFFD